MSDQGKSDTPDSTGALYMPTGELATPPATIHWSDYEKTQPSFDTRTTIPTYRLPASDVESAQLAWSQDEHSIEPEPFIDDEPSTGIIARPRFGALTKNWILLSLVAFMVAMITVVAFLVSTSVSGPVINIHAPTRPIPHFYPPVGPAPQQPSP